MPAGIIQPVWYGTTEEGTFGRLPGPPTYTHQSLPCYRFRKEADGKVEDRLINTQEELDALGPEWRDSPAKVDEPMEEKALEMSAEELQELRELRAWKTEQAQVKLRKKPGPKPRHEGG